MLAVGTIPAQVTAPPASSAAGLFPAPVTVIMPTFNRAAYIAQSVASVLGQTCPPAQVIVVDDGSTDGTAAVLDRFRDRIEYLRKENGGKSSALNLALQHVRQPLVWIFDDDDIALPDAIERHLAVLEKHPDVDFTYSGFRKLHREGDRWRLSSRLFEFDSIPDSETFPALLLDCAMTQQGMMVRRKCYDEVGPFETTLIRAQDYEMLLRLSRQFRGARVEGATFYLRVHGGPRGGTLDRHSGERREAQWYKYEKIIFRRLASTLPLGAYLPREIADCALDDLSRRRALFQRAAATARRGLWDIALEDLRIASSLCGSAPLSASEKELCTAIMDTPLAIEDMLAIGSGLREIVSLFAASGGAAQVRLYMARGLYRCAVGALGEGRYAAARRFASAFLTMAGVSGLGNAVSWIMQKRLASRAR